jgi:hypothetical protein
MSCLLFGNSLVLQTIKHELKYKAFGNFFGGEDVNETRSPTKKKNPPIVSLRTKTMEEKNESTIRSPATRRLQGP